MYVSLVFTARWTDLFVIGKETPETLFPRTRNFLKNPMVKLTMEKQKWLWSRTYGLPGPQTTNDERVAVAVDDIHVLGVRLHLSQYNPPRFTTALATTLSCPYCYKVPVRAQHILYVGLFNCFKWI